MKHIHELNPEDVQLIRAGEVVSSPAAAIGELIANALDAGSTHIDIDVDKDARGFIVSDNGCGIPNQELLLALQRHTTSKFIDRKSIGTDISFGFRGEALHALATMCRTFTLSSRISGDIGFKINVENGDIPYYQKGLEEDYIMPYHYHWPNGTMVSIEGLFETHRPRLESMRKSHIELNAIRIMVASWAVCSTATITLTIDKKKTVYSGDMSQRALQAQNNKFGITSVIDIEKEINGKTIHIKGVLLPSSTRYFSINGRPVSWNGFLDSALLNISRTHGTGFILDISMPREDVDVNIHPEKSEVRTKIDIRKALMDALSQTTSGGQAGLSQTVKEVRDAVKKQAMAREDAKDILGIQILDMIEDKYAVATHNGQLILCDIHAAHERMLQNQGASSVSTYSMYLPITLPDQDISLIQHISLTLEEEGWSFFMDSVGAFITRAPCPEEKAISILAHILEYGESPLATVSCHHAWKTGMERDDALFREIIHYALHTPKAIFCSHGRPVIVSLNKSTLDHIFERA